MTKKDDMSKPSASYLDHDGNPSPKDQIEILKVCALAIGFVGGTAAISAKLIELGGQPWKQGFLLFLVIPDLVLSVWST